MRKAFAVLAVLLVLAVGFTAAAAALVTGSADAVQLQHTTLYGDVNAAAGVLVTGRLQCHRRLFWEVEFPLVPNPGATVKFESHLAAQVTPSGGHTPAGVTLGAYTRGGASTSGSFDEDWSSMSDPFAGMIPVFRDVASRVPAGEHREETIYLKDYFEYYPLSVDVDLVGGDILQLPDGSEPAPQAPNAAFAEFFRIPVLEKNTLTVGIGKNAAGQVQNVDVYDPENTGPELFGPSVVDENAVYFALNFGAEADTSRIPGGVGIYCLPYEITKTATGSRDVSVIHPEQLRCVFPLAQEARVVEMHFSPQGGLLLLTRQDGWLWLNELELPPQPGEPLRLLAQQKLLPVGAEEYIRGSVLFEDCLLVLDAKGAFVLLQQDAQGLYKPVLTGDTTPAEAAGMSIPFGPDMTFLWDGQRLVAAQYMVQLYHDGCNDMYAAVFTADGLQYVGHIASSLSRNVGLNTSWSVYPDDTDPLQLSLLT